MAREITDERDQRMTDLGDLLRTASTPSVTRTPCRDGFLHLCAPDLERGGFRAYTLPADRVREVAEAMIHAANEMLNAADVADAEDDEPILRGP